MTTPSPDEWSATVRYLPSNVDDERADLERAQSALVTATAYGRIVLGRSNDEGGAAE
jgi:hypothetical protein